MNENNQEMIQEFLKLDWLIQINILQNFPEKFDYETLIEFQKSSDSDVRNLAEELAWKIPAEKLDFETLIEFQESNNPNIKYLARKLALKHFPEKIPTYKKFVKKYFE